MGSVQAGDEREQLKKFANPKREREFQNQKIVKKMDDPLLAKIL